MLLFIFDKPSFSFLSCKVSIHLMLLFIKTWLELESLSRSFNTSHVTLYRARLLRAYRLVWSFNTSHVTLYRGEMHIRGGVARRFNTSHVTLYQNLIFPAVKYMRFQYISCYSLSATLQRIDDLRICFNTSHVTLYPSFYRLFFF